MILSLFLPILEIYCLLTPNSIDKLVPFSNDKIIDKLFIFYGKNGMLMFCGHDVFICRYKACMCSSNHAD